MGTPAALTVIGQHSGVGTPAALTDMGQPSSVGTPAALTVMGQHSGVGTAAALTVMGQHSGVGTAAALTVKGQQHPGVGLVSCIDSLCESSTVVIFIILLLLCVTRFHSTGHQAFSYRKVDIGSLKKNLHNDPSVSVHIKVRPALDKPVSVDLEELKNSTSLYLCQESNPW